MDCFEVKIEESKKASSCTKSNPEHLVGSALPLSYNNWTTTSSHNPLYGWWLSDCLSSVAEHWRLNSEVSWV